MSLADSYGSFADLAQAQAEGTDYRVITRHVAGSSVAILAPHGGRIEQGTSLIALQVAGDEFSLYLLEGLCDRSYSNLHLTSTRFDDPRALDLITGADHVVALHGYRADEEMILLGGLDGELKETLAEALRQAGLAVRLAGHQFMATDPNNICNRGRAGQGVQIELSRGLRMSGRLATAGQAIRAVLLALSGSGTPPGNV
ncbi:MAG TPA: poly-gamma-glutamate hydrolase family protein [Burkholderiales bacterium]